MKKIYIIAYLVLASFGLSFAETTTPKNPRYISLAPSTTEILFALGLDKEIVGVSSYCNYPPEAKTKESIGNFSRPNIEKILSLEPDCIFCTGLEQAPIIDELKRLNLKVYASDPRNIKELFDSIRDIAKITRKNREAEDLIKDMQIQIDDITSQAKSIPRNKRLKVFIEIFNDPLTTAGKGTFIDELITMAGGINIAGDTIRPYTIFSQEEVIKRNPDCIIIAYMGQEKPAELMLKRFAWDSISALKNNRIYNDIDPDTLLRPGPRVVSGLKEIYKRLYIK
ncbi:MAG: cobalamin-binding protein [Candidatus Omnitrophica bacterium]|nr:cobalamin-binding protein [Candidatus Omnitrophota bacterium]